MRNRTLLLLAGLLLLALLATGGTVGAMALMHTGPFGSGRMMNYQQRYGGMMGGQQHGMMGGYQQNPGQQGSPAVGLTKLTIQNFAYQPATLQVKAGTTVTWTNQDNVPHSVTFKNGMKDSGLLYQGQSFRSTFTSPGTYQYYCTVHPYMVATVIVTQ